jgi:hypothetical protein
VLIAGGYDGSITIPSAEIFNPDTNSFTSVGVGSLSGPLSDAAAAALGNGQVLVAGGYNGSDDTKSAELFDPATSTFGPAGSMSLTRSGFAGASLPDGRAVVIGGQNPGGDLKTAETFDPATKAFSTAGLGEMSVQRKYLAAAPLGGGRVLVAGGYTSGNPTKGAEILGTSDAFTAKLKGRKLIATVSSAGTLSVAGATVGATAAKKRATRLLKPSTATGGPGQIRVKLKLTKGANATLRRAGKLKVRAAITFAPDAGFAATRALKLKLKR